MELRASEGKVVNFTLKPTQEDGAKLSLVAGEDELLDRVMVTFFFLNKTKTPFKATKIVKLYQVVDYPLQSFREGKLHTNLLTYVNQTYFYLVKLCGVNGMNNSVLTLFS